MSIPTAESSFEATKALFNASQAEATQHLIKASPSTDGSSERAIQRLAKDTCTLVKPSQSFYDDFVTANTAVAPRPNRSALSGVAGV